MQVFRVTDGLEEATAYMPDACRRAGCTWKVKRDPLYGWHAVHNGGEAFLLGWPDEHEYGPFLTRLQRTFDHFVCPAAELDPYTAALERWIA